MDFPKYSYKKCKKREKMTSKVLIRFPSFMKFHIYQSSNAEAWIVFGAVSENPWS